MELLAVQLKQDVHCTVRGLAQQLGVSSRTIARDLALMRDQGMQIDADRGRGGVCASRSQLGCWSHEPGIR